MTNLNINELHNARHIFRQEIDASFKKLFDTDIFQSLSGEEQLATTLEELSLMHMRIHLLYFYECSRTPPEFEKIFKDNMKDLLA